MIGFLRVNVWAFYNVTCRGNEQQAIFRDDADRVSFLSQLADSLENYHVTLHVVLLMDDHFHLVIYATRCSCGKAVSETGRSDQSLKSKDLSPPLVIPVIFCLKTRNFSS